MDHRPYEEWLLNDDLKEQFNLTPEQQRDLRVHLRNCPECTALEQASYFLRSSAAFPPAGGFSLRFQQRLAMQRSVQQRRALIGWFILAIVGVGALIWLLFPYLFYLMLTPAQIAGKLINNLVYITLMARAFNAILITFLNLLSSNVPLVAWMLLVVLLSGLAKFWSFSVRKAGKLFQPVV